jgi:hypothetical protein
MGICTESKGATQEDNKGFFIFNISNSYVFSWFLAIRANENAL